MESTLVIFLSALASVNDLIIKETEGASPSSSYHSLTLQENERLKTLEEQVGNLQYEIAVRTAALDIYRKKGKIREQLESEEIIRHSENSRDFLIEEYNRMVERAGYNQAKLKKEYYYPVKQLKELIPQIYLIRVDGSTKLITPPIKLEHFLQFNNFNTLYL